MSVSFFYYFLTPSQYRKLHKIDRQTLCKVANMNVQISVVHKVERLLASTIKRYKSLKQVQVYAQTYSQTTSDRRDRMVCK